MPIPQKQNFSIDFTPKPFDFRRAFSRSLGLVSEAELEKLQQMHVAIPGCGGVGGIHAQVLARLGVGRFSIADTDSFELENFNRQFGARIQTLQKLKTQVIESDILGINPDAKVRVFDQGVRLDTIDAFLSSVDLVVDSLDFFAFSARDLLFTAARRRGIPVITAAPLGFSSAVLLFTAQSMPYERYFDFKQTDSDTVRAIKFLIGLAPKGLHRNYIDRSRMDLKNKRGPSSGIGVTLCAGIAGTLAIKVLLKRGPLRASPHYLQYDAFNQKYKQGYLRWGNRNLWQKLKLYFARRLYANQ